MPGARGIALAAALAALATLAACGCGRDPVRPPFVREATLFGYLYVGEPISAGNAIRVGETRPADAAFDADEAALSGALVILHADGAPAPDTLAEVAPGRYAKPSVIVQPATTYRLMVVAGGRSITAETTTPQALTVTGGPPAAPQPVAWSAIPLSHPFEVAGPDPAQILLVDVFCREPWWQAEYVTPLGPDTHPRDEREYGGGTGQPRHITAYFRMRDLGPPADRYRIGFYGDMMAFYGEYDVGLFAIDDNLYAWLYRDRPERHAGVQGGIGVFGSAWRLTRRVNVVR